MKSSNIIFPKQGQVQLALEDVPDPQDDQVLCTAIASLVSIGTESTCLKGVYEKGTYWEEYIQYPFAPGYSMVAVVAKVGPGVSKFKQGDRVTSLATHAQHFLMSQDDLFAVPDDITDDEAVWTTLARTTQLGVRRAQLVMGESVCVVGLGILGQLVTQYLALSGARQIIAIDLSRTRLDLAKSHGATHTICLPVEEAIAEVKSITGGRMTDVAFDVTGFPSVLAGATRLVRKLGRVVLLGDSATPSQQNIGPRIVGDSIAILGVHGLLYPREESPFNIWTAENMNSLFFHYIRSKKMQVMALLTHRRSPQDAEEIYTSLVRNDDVLGVVLDWSSLKQGDV
ncbi:uncharacterized protein FMAN_02060 [Fusarium mangiferae]|uniref:Uncharacterized protein n=1 Tax=Fusarium mangiferae TaxID=192010 RepID=A0A1L7SF40_FUSMA|nr:uncharacterized protein FMAN_02060 [Fusarium mangiferae]CVK85151.1 uncharacterized protein FMAN_02060 [Fusarium mangiferae]